ncbi:rhamnulokinase, partial [Alloacidobacterium sp.]|uniref:rhamnulokinase n=1 Tax=Alloacidobacterium sp. TaxID=2951999 RepID=UPI002D4E942B
MPAEILPTIVAIDLGAESCRVSLLEWEGRKPRIELMHRFGNAPVEVDGALRWNLDLICEGLEQGLHRCASKAQTKIASVGVDGWAVDYVRLKEDGLPVAAPYCYRDTRTGAAEAEVRKRISFAELFALSGVQPLRINTLFQLVADQMAGAPAESQWINLPEYILMRLGGSRIAEYSNATHSGMMSAGKKCWNPEIFTRCGLDASAAPPIASSGSWVGEAKSAAFKGTKLIAPCCHDTAAAIAGISLHGDDWAYISSGTWSLVGMLLDHTVTSSEAFAGGFTNLGAAGGQICFHKNVNGMWLLKQCMAQLCPLADMWPMPELVAAAERQPQPANVLDVDDPDLLLFGHMASRINAQFKRRGFEPIEEDTSAMPQYASLIFYSLAARYAEVLQNAAELSGKKLKRL